MKRCASSRARSRMSPTSRSSRSVSTATIASEARRIVDEPLRRARTRGRGSRSAGCAARARPTSGSSALAPPTPGDVRSSRRTARRGGRSRPGPAAAARRRSCRPRPRRLPAKARAADRRAAATRTTRTRPRRGARRPNASRQPPHERVGELVDRRLLLRDDDRADRASSPPGPGSRPRSTRRRPCGGVKVKVSVLPEVQSIFCRSILGRPGFSPGNRLTGPSK